MLRTTRREALVTIAAGFAARPLGAQVAYEPKTFAADEYELLGALVDMILPPTDTPGAREVGVHAMLDEDFARDDERLGIIRGGLATLTERGFLDLSADGQVALLTEYSEAAGSQRDFFETLKGLTIDAYYATEVGLVDELGYQGNTYLAEFKGCTHDHGIEGAD